MTAQRLAAGLTTLTDIKANRPELLGRTNRKQLQRALEAHELHEEILSAFGVDSVDYSVTDWGCQATVVAGNGYIRQASGSDCLEALRALRA